MNTKITAKDFFLHIAVIALLYTGAVALLNLLFRVINEAFPQVDQYYGYSGSSSISLPVATLIVAFPLFLFLANILGKSYLEDPSKRDYPVRKGLIYLTLFIAGAILAGDLVTLIYFFLDGQELTTAFLLKILSVLVVTGAVFGYYMDDLKGRLDARKNIWRVTSVVLVIGSIVLGFSVLGSPQTQREMRYDSQKVEDLNNIQWQIVNFWQQKRVLPSVLAELEDPISGFIVPLDPQTSESYRYEKTGALSFNLCATFATETEKPLVPPIKAIGEGTWSHGAGDQCFERTIDPDLYKPVSR